MTTAQSGTVCQIESGLSRAGLRQMFHVKHFGKIDDPQDLDQAHDCDKV